MIESGVSLSALVAEQPARAELFERLRLDYCCGGGLICPWHGSRFDLHTGAVLEGPAVFVQPRIQAREREGKIEIGVPGAGGAELPELNTFRPTVNSSS